MSQQQAWTGGTTVSRDHTELHEVIYGYFGPSTAINSYKSTDQQDHELTDVILAAGYRKPRTITTVEELDALPLLSSVLCFDAKGVAYPAQRGEAGWRLPFLDMYWPSVDLFEGCESMTVLHEGQA